LPDRHNAHQGAAVPEVSEYAGHVGNVPGGNLYGLIEDLVDLLSIIS